MSSERYADFILMIFESRLWAILVLGLTIVNLWHGEVYAAAGNVSVWLLIFAVGRSFRRAQRDIEIGNAEIEEKFHRGSRTLH